MSAAPFDPEAVIDAMAPLLGLRIEPDWRAGVAANLTVAAHMADLVLAGVADHDDPAALFVPAPVVEAEP